LRPMTKNRILYLDQNIWIELLKSIVDQQNYQDITEVRNIIFEQVDNNNLVVPLTYTNIYETQKINDLARRKGLARLQSSLSRGWVFRTRSDLLRAQISNYLSNEFLQKTNEYADNWFISQLFWEAASPLAENPFGCDLSEKFIESIQSNPCDALFSYLTDLPDDVRREGVENFSNSSKLLINRIENRRKLVSGQNSDFRKRVYNAQLITDHIDEIFRIARYMKLKIATINDLGPSRILAIISKIPTLHIEMEIVIKIEGEAVSLEENDIRDILALTQVFPYADIIVGEKAALGRARQAKLHQTYKTQLFTKLSDLNPEILQA
jgi:hypothetical protein